MSLFVRGCALMMTLWAGAADAQRDTSASRPITVREGFIEELRPGRDPKPAADLSGIACRPVDTEVFRCLVVNDESQFAQWATYHDGVLAPEAIPIPLIGPVSPGPGEAVGTMAAVGSCPGGETSFKEFDGEGIAWARDPSSDGIWYVVGSHSCGRQSPRLRASTHLLARLREGGRRVTLSWRLGPSLRAQPEVGAHYNRSLTKADQGLDIEGIAALGDELFLGLRAPAPTHATILRAPAHALFEEGTPPEAPVPLRAHRVALGRYEGVRDLAVLPGGRLLILSGGSQSDDELGEQIPQRLHLVTVDDAADWSPRTLLERIVPPNSQLIDAKAEGIAVLGAEHGVLRLLVLFENPRRGGALELRVLLP